jgi:membrane protein DedA with SNARE-associated domain
LALLSTLVGVSFVVANVGTFMSARLVKNHPAWLLALSSRNRHLLLVKGTDISGIAFVLIPVIRLLPVAIAYYLLAYHYGDRGKAWMEREAGGVPTGLNWMERLFDRVGPAVLLFFAASQLAWLLAGLRRVTLKQFVAFETAGVALRLAFFWALGERFKPQLEDALEVIGKLQRPLTILLLFMVVYQTSKTMKRLDTQTKAANSATIDDPNEGSDTHEGLEPER